MLIATVVAAMLSQPPGTKPRPAKAPPLTVVSEHFTVKLERAETIELSTVGDKGQTIPPRPFLKITIRITNKSKTPLKYFSWTKSTSHGNKPAFAVSNDNVKMIAPNLGSGIAVDGQRDDELIQQKTSMTDVIVLDFPPENAKSITVTFPSGHLWQDVGETGGEIFGGPWSVEVPRSFWVKPKKN